MSVLVSAESEQAETVCLAIPGCLACGVESQFICTNFFFFLFFFYFYLYI